MTHLDIIRAWKDEEYRLSLNEAERTQLPSHPAGLIELPDAQLDTVAGGYAWIIPLGVALLEFGAGYIAGRYMDRLVNGPSGPSAYPCGQNADGTAIMCLGS